jgi:hypothetical protein
MPESGNPATRPVWRLIVRLVLDVIKTREGRYEGSLTVPGTGARHDFAGILELLAILEEQLGPEEIQHTRPEGGARPDRITGEQCPS